MFTTLLDQRWFRPLVLLVLLSAGIVPLAGCGGCNNNPSAKTEEEQSEEEKKKKEKEKKKKPLEDFSIGSVLSQPNDVIKDRQSIPYVKRGHWVTAAQSMKANNFDVQAELVSVTASSDGAPFDIEHTNYSLRFSRPLPLPKGQVRLAESLFFIPRERVDARPPMLRNEMVPQKSALASRVETTPVLPLEEWQYIFLVLSSRPNAFNVLEQTQTFSPHTDTVFGGDPSIWYYQLLRPSIDRRAPLPSNPLTWTSIAVVLLDDLDPNKIEPPQQQALLDWLHWGGQLLVSGPNTLDRYRGTFLEPYLPATTKQSINLTQEHFAELNAFWSLREKSKPQQPRDLKLVKEIVGLELELAPHGRFMPHTGELVAEGRVGRGRIVVTAFSLASGVVQSWSNFDGFLNGGLLRRPARLFAETHDSNGNRMDFETRWADESLRPFRRDSRLISGLRYFARDMAFAEGDEQQHPYTDLQLTRIDPDFSTGEQSQILSTGLDIVRPDDERFAGYLAVPRAGVGAWNDFSGTSNVARRHLNEAAGVTIPNATFVLKVLAAYLVVLVPLNWALFRTIGRVEWAWVAAPVIAIVGAVTVIRLAQLDIGFARSRTEIDVVEFQEGYSRAHVSRFIALYTSLASGYNLEFDDETALAQPLAVNNRYRRKIGETPYEVHLRRDRNLSFTGFQVRSNSTGSIHAEQMYEAGGSLELTGDEATGWQVRNGTDLPLNDVGVFRRTTTGNYAAAYVPSLSPGATTSLRFAPVAAKYKKPASDEEARDLKWKIPTLDLWLAEWESSPVMSRAHSQGATGELRLGRFAELATQRLTLLPGDVRLVAWSPKEIEGVRYSPDAAQTNGVSFVLAHLRRGEWDEPERDRNVLQDVSKIVPGESNDATTEESGSALP